LSEKRAQIDTLRSDVMALMLKVHEAMASYFRVAAAGPSMANSVAGAGGPDPRLA
jgi:hypothetical protein